MPKTKRDHFKTSVQSALGGSAGREVVGYAVSERISRLLAAVVPLTGTVIAVHNTPKGPWYFFVFDVGNPSICRLWSVPDQPIPSSAAHTVVDTGDWYSTASRSLVQKSTKITYTTGASTPSLTITIVQNPTDPTDYYLDDNSLCSFLSLMGTSDFHANSGSWNEIGKS